MSPCFDRLFTACMSRLVMLVNIALIKKKRPQDAARLYAN